jgi:phage baseplate assembly protein W
MATTPLSELAISLPFKVDALGKVGATITQEKIWLDKVRSVIGTSLGQRVYRPSFGCNATLGIFDTEEYVLNTIEEDISRSFASFLPLLVLESVEVSVDAETETLTVEVQYETPSGSSNAVRLGIATINGNNAISEEFSWQTQ